MVASLGERTPGPDRSGLLALVVALAAGCLAPPPGAEGETGTAEELGELMAESGAEGVVGEVAEEPAEIPDTEEHELADPEAVELPQEPEAALEVEESPYIRFGERIIVRPFEDGSTFVTKPYTLPIGRAQKVVDLMKALEPFPFRHRPMDPEGELPPLDRGILEYEILKDWDQAYYTEFQPLLASDPKFVPQTAQPISLADVLVVTAAPDLLEEFEGFLDLFAAGGIPQIELEAKIIEIVESDSLDVGVRQVDGDTPIFQFGSSNFVNAFSFDLPNFAESSEALLSLGAIQDSVEFNAVIEAVKNWQNVSIESRPKTVVRAGGVALIDSATEIPFAEFKTLAPDGTFTTATAYKRTGVQLVVSPRVIGSQTLALDVQVQGSQQVGTQATLAVAEGGGFVEVPVISYRTAKTLVYLQPGQTLVIGGLTTTREQEIESKVPILGDIPILGWFFRSTFQQVERQHVLFAISPRILQRSDFEADL